MKRYIAGLGEALWDVLPKEAKLGGTPANFAYHASQFGHLAVAVSALDNDNLSDQTVRELNEKGLKYIIPRVSYPTGMVGVELNAGGVSTYDIRIGVARDYIPFTPEVEAVAHNCSAVCFGSLAQRNEQSRATIGKLLDVAPGDCPKIFDINLRDSFYTGEAIQASFKRCNTLGINDGEPVTIGRFSGYPGLDIENKYWLTLGKYNLDMFMLTCGMNDSYVFAKGLKSSQKTPEAEVAGTVGAGDPFTSTFTAVILSRKPIKEAHELVVKVNAHVCTQKGIVSRPPEKFTTRTKG